MSETLIERLRHRALARLGLKHPTGRDRVDAKLDNDAAAALTVAQARIEELEAEELRNHHRAADNYDRAIVAETALAGAQARIAEVERERDEARASAALSPDEGQE